MNDKPPKFSFINAHLTKIKDSRVASKQIMLAINVNVGL